jgi:hypothetical protein
LLLVSSCHRRSVINDSNYAVSAYNTRLCYLRRVMVAMKVARFTVCALAWMIAVLCNAWAFGALDFDLPAIGAWAAILLVLVLLAAVAFVRGTLLKLVVVFSAFALVALWWLTLKPSNDRP